MCWTPSHFVRGLFKGAGGGVHRGVLAACPAFLIELFYSAFNVGIGGSEVTI